MPRRPSRTLTDLELAIMQVVWKVGESSVEDVRVALDAADRPLALPSVRTMLAILCDKGYLTRRKLARSFLYRPVVSEARARRRILRDVLDRAFDGSASTLVAALVRSDMLRKRDLARIRQLIERHDKETRK